MTSDKLRGLGIGDFDNIVVVIGGVVVAEVVEVVAEEILAGIVIEDQGVEVGECAVCLSVEAQVAGEKLDEGPAPVDTHQVDPVAVLEGAPDTQFHIRLAVRRAHLADASQLIVVVGGDDKRVLVVGGIFLPMYGDVGIDHHVVRIVLGIEIRLGDDIHQAGVLQAVADTHGVGHGEPFAHAEHRVVDHGGYVVVLGLPPYLLVRHVVGSEKHGEWVFVAHHDIDHLLGELHLMCRDRGALPILATGGDEEKEEEEKEASPCPPPKEDRLLVVVKAFDKPPLPLL